MSISINETPHRSVWSAIISCRNGFVTVGLMSALSNVLMLTGSLYMLQVYDRVLPSRSIPTLVGLSLLAGVLFVGQAFSDLLRSRVLVRIAAYVDGTLSERAYRADIQASVTQSAPSSVRDLDQVRAFLLSGGPIAFLDLPWIPLYTAICFIFHPWIGYAVLAGAVLLLVPTAVSERLTQRSTKRTNALAGQRAAFNDTSRRNAEVLVATGMLHALTTRWSRSNANLVASQQQLADVAGGFTSASKAIRMALQSAVLGLGAILVIAGEATGGVIIASSILVARALAPVEQVIAHWKGFIAARQSAVRLSASLAALADRTYTTLPEPKLGFSATGLSVTAPGSDRTVVNNVSLHLKPGQGLGIIGPSASGKSSLVRGLVGVWEPAKGKVRIDGAAIDQWSPQARNRHLGYVPQDVELFSGTIAENITRFEETPDESAMIAAAQAASVHNLILRLPDGYQTNVGSNGAVLSHGQRQRIALARALYRDPFIVVLDEPNSNLDQEGEIALTKALLAVRARGGIVVLVAHRPSALAAVDTLMVMQNGEVQTIGRREDILERVLQFPKNAQAHSERQALVTGASA